jgi:hypothetical protein
MNTEQLSKRRSILDLQSIPVHVPLKSTPMIKNFDEEQIRSPLTFKLIPSKSVILR